MSIHRWIIIVFMSGLGLGVPVGAVAQVTGGDDVEGYWLGAFVRDGSVQVLEAEFYPEDDTMRAAMTIPDWTYYRPYVRPVTRDDEGRFVVETVYGTATMQLDTTFQEMIGVVDGHEPPLRIHLKRNLRPVTPPVRTEAVQFDHGDVTLSGTLVLPDAPGPHPAVVFVHGRGRSRGNWRLPRAKLLAQRGIAALVYDKRGVGDSGGDWDTATVHDLAGDAAAALATVAAHPDVDAERAGLYGSSAGGWVAPRAYVLSDVPPAFVITRVGPATSVEEQQLDVVHYLADQADLDAAERARFNEFIRVENDLSLSDEAVYERLTALLNDERNADWADFLADAAPESPEDVPGLWVRRHAYDPADALRQIDVPFLAIYGEDDYVVPPDENVPLLRQLLDEAGNTDYRILVLPEAGHGLEHGHRLRTLDDGGMKRYYFKYDRVAPGAYQAIVDFLNETMLSSDTSP